MNICSAGEALPHFLLSICLNRGLSTLLFKYSLLSFKEETASWTQFKRLFGLNWPSEYFALHCHVMLGSRKWTKVWHWHWSNPSLPILCRLPGKCGHQCHWCWWYWYCPLLHGRTLCFQHPLPNLLCQREKRRNISNLVFVLARTNRAWGKVITFCNIKELLYKLLSAPLLGTEGTKDEKWIYLQRNVWYTVVVSIYAASLLKLLTPVCLDLPPKALDLFGN